MQIKVNSDKELVKKIREKLHDNEGYCPCKLVKDQSTKCICKEFIDSSEPGPCHCGLYIKEL